ncbi:helix-turn-helix domain-containing protein, partial [Sporosarcina ureae]|uniref:helix-turn-helix domain-containing protein n=1 Tax=Sporosarcina ureae TaxID=1571 RepID=UPI0012DF0CE9
MKHLRSGTLVKSTYNGGVFAWAKNVYSSEVKWAVVKDKLSGELTTKEIMEKHGVKNKSQIETWMRWYRANEIYRFDQPIGKQYTFGHGPELSS